MENELAVKSVVRERGLDVADSPVHCSESPGFSYTLRNKGALKDSLGQCH